MIDEGRSPLLNFFMASMIAVFDWLAKLGIVKPALPPLVPWQPAQALDSISALGVAASADADKTKAPVARANPLHRCFIFVSSF
jgi:hypothetical protein